MSRFDRRHFDAENGGSFSLQDGDKIAVLAADFISEQLAIAGISDIHLGIVQTAYANGGAYDYVVGKNIECAYAKTGVKVLAGYSTGYSIRGCGTLGRREFGSGG